MALTWNDLEGLVSAERLGPYRAAAPNEASAFDLYMWNARVGSAYGELIGHLEVVLRNCMHDSLMALNADQPGRGSKAWFDEPAWTRHHWLSSQAKKDRDRAIRRARHDPARTPRPGKVVSELNFGFWRYLVSHRYEQGFWVPAIDHDMTVPGETAALRRSTLEDTIAPLHLLRNRVAHHEPLINDVRVMRSGGVSIRYPLASLVTAATEVASWISAEAQELLEAVDEVTPLLAQRPA